MRNSKICSHIFAILIVFILVQNDQRGTFAIYWFSWAMMYVGIYVIVEILPKIQSRKSIVTAQIGLTVSCVLVVFGSIVNDFYPQVTLFKEDCIGIQ
uniref:Dolichol-phosphate mannosyltransferase subunit 3 n=1 Tax=Caenorhabditis tropicalis TaxID=1561998 RepID=A0A1I7ULT7_9PELO